MASKRRTVPAVERFWAKVAKTDTCWLWTGAPGDHGYGHISVGGRHMYAHRFAWELLVGPIPPKMHIDHICHVPACVRPDHLRVCTAKQNGENRLGPSKRNRTSGVRGVHWSKARQKWVASVGHNRGVIPAGRFETLAEAEKAAIALRNRLYTHNDADRLSTKTECRAM